MSRSIRAKACRIFPAPATSLGALAANTALLNPEKFTNKEVGVKWDILPRLQFTAAIYQLDRQNTRAADPARPSFFIATGASRARGFEARLSGYVTDSWQVQGGFAHTDAKFVSTTSTALAGNRLQLVPQNTFSLWNRYNFTQQIGAGFGAIHQSSAFAAVENAVRLPGFTRVDAAVFVQITERIKAQLNVEDIFNTRYYASVDGNNNITPGSPRAGRLTITGTF